jgi:hypothetical protein
MILGYIISGEFNDCNMFSSKDDNLPICKKCGYVTDFEYISPMFKLKKKIYDISETYDSHTIVSNKFKEFCIRNNYKGLEFKELPNDKNYYSFFVRNILLFDIEKAELKFDNYCDECKNYESVTPAIPMMIKGLTEPLKEDGIFATDIHFASGNEKSPCLIIGITTYEKMKKEKFKGMNYLKFDTELSVPWDR